MDDGTETRVALDPVTGEVLPSTAGGDFFFRLHYNLHAGNLGMYIVGLAGMLAFAAIIAGILIHKRIFKDFFTFRAGAGKQRAWLDAHNLTGVLGLPFHLLISYTGVIIFATSYMFAWRATRAMAATSTSCTPKPVDSTSARKSASRSAR